jgi:hypothetical protein
MRDGPLPLHLVFHARDLLGLVRPGPGRDGLSDEDIRGRVGASAAFDAGHLLAAGEDRVVGTIEPNPSS